MKSIFRSSILLLFSLVLFSTVILRNPAFDTVVVRTSRIGAVSASQTAVETETPYAASRHGGNYMFNYYFPPAPSTTPWAPAWSPDGKQIACGLYGSIWRVDLATDVAYEMTQDPHYHSSPDWSPDGKWIVYTSDHGAATIQLEILNVETGDSHKLTNDRNIYTDPAFSRDGRWLAYVSTRPNGYFNIYIRPVSHGRWAGEEMALTEDHPHGKDRLYFGEWDMHIQPTWMPDGKEILFVSNRSVPLGSGHVWRMPVEPLGIRKARPILEEQSLYRTRPHVAPDGKRFIYSSTAGAADQFNHLYVLPTIGGSPYKMTFGAFDHFHPRWSPDGESILYISNQPAATGLAGLPDLWLMETYGGKKKKVEIREYRWKRDMGRVRVEVRDMHTGKRTAARIYGRASDGKFYAPRGAYSRIGTLGRHLFHTDGEFVLEVPPGRMTLEAVKGLEYWPIKREVEIKPGELSELVLELTPMLNMAAAGWYSGSTHLHMNYGGNLRNSLHNLMLMSRAEDQQVMNVLIANKDNRILDWQFFVPGGSGHPVSEQDGDLVVIVGEEYRPPFYGHIFLIGLRDHLISPFTTGYEGTGIESLYPSNTDTFRKARAQGAVVGYVHSFSGEVDPLEDDLGQAKGFPIDAALGTVHALEWSTSSRAALKVWHHALNNDLQVTPVGGEDAITDLHRSRPPGAFRTYAYLGDQLTAEAWIEALKQGRTFFTSGPLLDFKIDGRIPGESFNLPAAGGMVHLEGKVWSIVPLEKVMVYHNGSILRQIPLEKDQTSVSFQEQLQVKQSGWFSLTAEGPAASHPLEVNYPSASTNAIRVYVGIQKIRNRHSAEYFVRWIDRLKQLAAQWPHWRSLAERDHVFQQFDQARLIYLRGSPSAAMGQIGSPE